MFKPHKIILLILVIFVVVSLIAILFTRTEEGFESVPIIIDPDTNKIIGGYYQVDDTHMALLPYGFKVDPNDPTAIIPITATAIEASQIDKSLKPPDSGDKMLDGYYLWNEYYLAILPPNMMPNLRNIDFAENTNQLKYYYDVGYVSESRYYAKQFNPNNRPTSLPPELYYVDDEKTKMSFVRSPINQPIDGYGAVRTVPHPSITPPFNYKDILTNYDTEFHEDVNEMINRNGLYDLSFGEVRVLDQTGNLVVLPVAKSQGSITYYQPGEFPFGASTYIPNYEDSIYLSSIGFRSVLGNTNALSSNCGTMCKAYNDFKQQMDLQCN